MSKVTLPCRYGLLIIALSIGTFACKKAPARVPAATSRPTTQPAPAPAGPSREPTVEIKADPSILKPGESFTLSWNSTEAERLIIDNGIGTVAISGSLQIKPPQSSTYTAVATNRVGSASASTRVTVTTPEVEAAPPSSPSMEIEEIMRQGLIKDVFFEYDKSDLTPQAQETLKQDADYLRRFPNVAFILEGHCDERGTAEYNLALGDRRAQSAKDYLVSLGVNPSRLETISYGKERPFTEGHDEAAFALNRRAHFALRR
ncbi:MAG: peptidoglycan-associated lipoprotein Pal [Acidobacteria bacterium]|nr:peptidoglycan-associated lipoprotein Pal [Acidobacteriota bacterium]